MASPRAPVTPLSSASRKAGSSGTVSPRPKASNASISRRRRPVNCCPARWASPSESTRAAMAPPDRSQSDRWSGPSSCSLGTAMPTVNWERGARLKAV